MLEDRGFITYVEWCVVVDGSSPYASRHLTNNGGIGVVVTSGKPEGHDSGTNMFQILDSSTRGNGW